MIELNNSNELVTQFGKLEVMHSLARIAGYEESVPTIDEFIDNPYYLGKSLGQGLYPIWRRAGRIIYPTPYHSPKAEIVLSGAIGQGKSTFAKLIILYDICRLLSLKDPHEYYGLLRSTIISFALLNATKGLAGTVLWDDIQQWVENSAYFKSKVNLSKNRSTFFIKNIDITIGSRGRDFLGQATVGALFSEINDMTVVGDQGKDNLDTISKRRFSRFGHSGKEILGHLILDSSNKGNRSFIDVRLEQKRKDGVDDTIVFAYSHWEAHAHHTNYTGETFQVYAGDENRDPFIVTDATRDTLHTLQGNRIVDVPIEHKTEFSVNIIEALRDLAGISTYSTFSFLSSSSIINSVFSRPNIITKPLIVLDFFDEKQVLENYIDIKMCSFLVNKPRFIHIDLGLKWDSTGMACSYLDGYTDTAKYDPLTGKSVINREPIFVTEWVMEIRALPGQEVAIYKIKEFILTAKRMGLPIGLVSTDGFQSSGLRQDLTLKGIPTALISVDRTKDPYAFMRNAMLEGRLQAPNNEKLIREIRDLQEGDQKFDHPCDGSKDLTDAVCGSVWSCAQNIVKAGTVVDAKQLVNTLSAALSTNQSKFENLLNLQR